MPFFRRIGASTLVSASAVYLLSNILNALVPFVLLPVFTRFLAPAEYGQVAMFQTLLAALGSFAGLSVVGSAVRKYYDKDLGVGELQEFMATCLQIVVVTGIVCLAFVFAFRGAISAALGLDARWVVSAIFVSLATCAMQLRLGQWQVRRMVKQYARFQIGRTLLNAGMSLILVTVFLQGVAGRITAQIFAAAVFALLALLSLRREKLLAFLVWRPHYVAEALRFGIPLLPHTLGIFLLASLDRFVIQRYLGLADAGIYMVAVQLSGAVGLVFDAVNKAYGPWLFERLARDSAEEKLRIVRYTYAWFALILLGAGLAFLLGPWFVTTMAGVRYARAGEVIGWLALGHVFGGMYQTVANYIFYSKKTGMLSLATVFTGLLNAALLFVLVKLLGLRGAAIAFAGSLALRFLLTWWVAQRRHPMPWFHFSAKP